MADNSSLPPFTKTDYLTFDPQSMKDLLLRRLNAGGNFTDQLYEGSNWNSLLDVIATSFGLLAMSLNQTASEGTLSRAEVYRNMNQIVKMLNYAPVGTQTSLLSFKAEVRRDENDALLIADGVYTLPRYANFSLNGISYSFRDDISFAVSYSDPYILALSDDNVLAQGKFEEYPPYFALGEEYETLTLFVSGTGNTVSIDHFGIDVYVSDGVNWTKWNRVESLYLEGPTSKSFEVRLNEAQRYEIKFGNGINGMALTEGQEVSVFYLKTNGSLGEVGVGSLDGNTIGYIGSARFNQVVAASTGLSYMGLTEASNIIWTNETASTPSLLAESVESIRKNAPKHSRYRNFTTSFLESYITRMFRAVAYSAKVVSNKDYVSGHLAYMLKMNEGKSSRFLQNTTAFSTSSGFNNIYLYVIPNSPVVDLDGNAVFISNAQKQYMLNGLKGVSIPNAEFVFLDPVYTEYAFGSIGENDIEIFDAIDRTTVVIESDPVNKRSSDAIINDFITIVANAFDYTNNVVGGTIDYSTLNFKLRNISGVNRIITRRTIDGVNVDYDGVSLISFSRENPKEDFAIRTSNHTLPAWKFPYFNVDALKPKISVQYVSATN